MKIIFRCDASEHIGIGHVMRCLSLANHLKQEGISSHFICREHVGHLGDYILTKGYSMALLPLKKLSLSESNGSTYIYDDWLGAHWESDAIDVATEVLKKSASWVIVDHYAVDFNWENVVKNMSGVKIMQINGLANQRHVCDLLLDLTYSHEKSHRWEGLLPQQCRVISGPNFAPLRNEFIEEHQKIRKEILGIKRIFVCFGGSDEFNVTHMVVDALIELKLQNFYIDIVVGLRNPHKELLEKKYLQFDNVKIHFNPKNLASLMSNADLAISAGGTMVLEQCFLGVPTIVLSSAENQIRASKQLQEAGAIIYLGYFNSVRKSLIKSTILKLIMDISIINKMRMVAQKIMAEPELSLASVLKDSI
jgi:UDP-2,4-diacetamido-2,4,6-trideoxy-beta-L-altropyranose hydrolase